LISGAGGPFSGYNYKKHIASLPSSGMKTMLEALSSVEDINDFNIVYHNLVTQSMRTVTKVLLNRNPGQGPGPG
jgi:hypothetical protein